VNLKDAVCIETSTWPSKQCWALEAIYILKERCTGDPWGYTQWGT